MGADCHHRLLLRSGTVVLPASRWSTWFKPGAHTIYLLTYSLGWMFSFLLLCYHDSVMKTNGHHILVIGSSSPLLEGVADLLQLAGYRVETSSSWAETEYAMVIAPPHLVIVDLSSSARDAYRLSEQLRRIPRWAEVPILFISFSGDDSIRSLQLMRNRKGSSGPVHYYAHTLLSMEGLLNQVRTCLS